MTAPPNQALQRTSVPRHGPCSAPLRHGPRHSTAVAELGSLGVSARSLWSEAQGNPTRYASHFDSSIDQFSRSPDLFPDQTTIGFSDPLGLLTRPLRTASERDRHH